MHKTLCVYESIALTAILEWDHQTATENAIKKNGQQPLNQLYLSRQSLKTYVKIIIYKSTHK